jgi:hypothetical protein
MVASALEKSSKYPPLNRVFAKNVAFRLYCPIIASIGGFAITLVFEETTHHLFGYFPRKQWWNCIADLSELGHRSHPFTAVTIEPYTNELPIQWERLQAG